jgi:glycosyltransferase involved in cell wall biosynthesis
VLSALDLACSSSFSEGFSNALAEAMSCSVACVGTDVGDTATLIGDAGRTVPPNDPAALAGAIVGLLRLPPSARAELQARARAQVSENFGADALVQRTIAAWSACRSSRPAQSRVGH